MRRENVLVIKNKRNLMKQYLLLLIVLLGVGTGVYFFWWSSETVQTGTIIFLNGSSSAGKTSIAKELQKLFDVPHPVPSFCPRQ